MIQVKHDDSFVFNKRNQLFPNMQIYNRLGNPGNHIFGIIIVQIQDMTLRTWCE